MATSDLITLRDIEVVMDEFKSLALIKKSLGLVNKIIFNKNLR